MQDHAWVGRICHTPDMHQCRASAMQLGNDVLNAADGGASCPYVARRWRTPICAMTSWCTERGAGREAVNKCQIQGGRLPWQPLLPVVLQVCLASLSGCVRVCVVGGGEGKHGVCE